MAAVVGATVPDYRGRFLRHVGGNSAALGVAQGDAIRNISGGVYRNGGDEFLADSPTANGAIYILNPNSTKHVQTYAAFKGGGDAFIFDASRVVPTAVENRPVNMAIKYIIFVGI